MSSQALALDIVTIEQKNYETVLKTPAKTVFFPLNSEDKELIEAMKAKLESLGGVGLAAPQVNAHKRIIAVYIPEGASLLRDNVEMHPMHILINPSFKPESEETVSDFEACYSVTSLAGKVPRFNRIKLSYQDETGQSHQKIASGFYARVLQHEIDHINGFLIKDRLTPDCVQGSVEDILALRRAELSSDKQKLFDEIMSKKRKG
ncbi:peptide deformylase [Legionella yabuuchiae]|uniref:peptide deformylase n=1 Tax=Legionella yabuuchiae TaxID=376727 RepID=UPI001F5FC000|nr:peptide deformylase [Legionella yabuuchiae]